MLAKSLIVLGTVFLASAAFAQSGGQKGSSSNSAPGQQMHDAKKSTGPGASEYAPGQKMQDAKKSTGPGASEYAPGKQDGKTTGGNSRR